MIEVIATATEIKNNFGRYLNIVQGGGEVVVTKKGIEVGRFIPKKTVSASISSSLIGILKGSYDGKKISEERVNDKYALND